MQRSSIMDEDSEWDFDQACHDQHDVGGDMPCQEELPVEDEDP